MQFESLPLHDALLADVYVSWDAALCDLRFCPVGLPDHLLLFEGFTHVELPRIERWGRSCSVDAVPQPLEGVFEVSLQSGDVIRIAARQWRFAPV